MNRTNIFIAISSAALLVLLLIQVNWIFETAKIKEALFNEKANIVLSRTTEALGTDKETCMKIGAAAELDNNAALTDKLSKSEIHKIDSIFTHYMKFYNFHINYTFEVVKPNPFTTSYRSSFTNNVYNKPLNEVVSKNGVELKLILPDKKQFIKAEMGTLFITSVVLILVVLVLFWQTILSLLKEKKISEHTTDFLNNMAHEFKTPLTNIALAGKMIIKDSINMQSLLPHTQEDKIKHYSEIILEENEKLKLQVEQVLSMTALEKGEVPLQKTAFDFHQLIKDSLKHISIQIEQQQGNVTVNLGAGKSEIMGDKTHLTNVFCNLIDNAIKYSANKPELIIETSTIGEDLIVLVSDKGIGIEKEYQKKVFDKYFRVPTGDVHDVKGFGIGLAYVKKIIALHGATIALESEKGIGTTFTITMPHV